MAPWSFGFSSNEALFRSSWQSLPKALQALHPGIALPACQIEAYPGRTIHAPRNIRRSFPGFRASSYAKNVVEQAKPSLPDRAKFIALRRESTNPRRPQGPPLRIEKHNPMHDNQRSDRRSRSGSRHRRNDNRGRRDSSYNSAPPRPQKPVKLSFWQKLVSLFTGKPKTASSSRSASAPSDRTDRQPSDNGHRRFESASSRQARKPELVEVSTPKIYVGNLSFDATENDLYELFNGVGQVQNAEIVSNKYTQKSKGFAFVTMLTVDEARRAVTELHDKDFMGRKLIVSGAKTGERESAPRPQEPREETTPTTP
jgi:hypothetical protein